MVRTSYVLLALGIVVAAGLFALLVGSLTAGPDRAERTPAREPPPRAPVPARSEERKPPRRPTPRAPAPLDAAAASARVAEILATLAREPNVAGRDALGAELRQLLSRLGTRVDPAAKRRLLDLLVTVDPQGRELVGRALGALEGDEETARRLLRLYREQTLPDIYATRAVFDALGRMRVPAVVPDLVALLQAESPHEILVAEALVAIGGSEASRALIERLERPARAGIHSLIVAALGKGRDPEVLRIVADRLPDADASARASFAEILGLARDARFAAPLRERFAQEPDPQVRKEMLRALGRIGDRESAKLLLEVIERGGPEKAHAVAAVHEIREPDTVEALATRWEELDPAVRDALLGAGAGLPDPPAALMAAARRVLPGGHAQTRVLALYVLGRPGREEDIEPLADRVERGTSERERRAAAEALLRIGTPAAGRAILERLTALPADVRIDYRARARAILGRKGN